MLQQRKGALIADIYTQFEAQYDPRFIDLLLDELKADNWIKSNTDHQEEYLLLQQPVQLALKKSSRQLLPKNDANPKLHKIRYLCMIAREFKKGNKTLLDWENGKPEVIELWKMMNSWVYEGFDITYKSIGCDFDKTYYESDTYLLGKDIVQDGLNKKIFFKKEIVQD